MIKLVVSDVDGTLVPDGTSVVNPQLFDVILKLREKGIQVAIASGRPWASIEKAFEPVKEKIFYISNNGAYLGCCGRSLFVTSIDRKILEELILAGRSFPDLAMTYAGENGDYIEDGNDRLYQWLTEGYGFRVTKVNSLLEVNEPCLKLSFYKEHGIEEAGRELFARFKDRLKITIAGDMWMDCMNPSVNKGQAVKCLQESLEILPEETAAFGDQLNDLEMLERAYYSFAVANAREEVRRAARYQADENVKDGVLKVLRQLV